MHWPASAPITSNHSHSQAIHSPVPLRLKLILSFIAASLSVVIIFGMVAYTSARDYTRHIELSHLHQDNLHLISMLEGDSPDLE